MPLVPLNELFGFQKCKVIPPTTLFHAVLPERSDESGKLLFPLYPFSGTWTHVELQKAVSLGYVIEEVYEQHHYPPSNRSNKLFEPYITTFFEMKKKAEQDKNPGMKQVAKLCLNSFYGKFGFNVENQDSTKIIRNQKQLWSVINSSYKRSNVDVINNAVAVATFHVERRVHHSSESPTCTLLLMSQLMHVSSCTKPWKFSKTRHCTSIRIPVSMSLLRVSILFPSLILVNWVPGRQLKDTPGDFFTEFVSAGPKDLCSEILLWQKRYLQVQRIPALCQEQGDL
jgi:hypothetical protein